LLDVTSFEPLTDKKSVRQNGVAILIARRATRRVRRAAPNNPLCGTKKIIKSNTYETPDSRTRLHCGHFCTTPQCLGQRFESSAAIQKSVNADTYMTHDVLASDFAEAASARNNAWVRVRILFAAL